MSMLIEMKKSVSQRSLPRVFSRGAKTMSLAVEEGHSACVAMISSSTLSFSSLWRKMTRCKKNQTLDMTPMCRSQNEIVHPAVDLYDVDICPIEHVAAWFVTAAAFENLPGSLRLVFHHV